jgi:hypothetical protein
MPSLRLALKSRWLVMPGNRVAVVPTGLPRVLLAVIAKEPHAVLRALAG